MKRNRILYLIFAILFILPSIFVLAGCFGSGTVGINIDNSRDLVVSEPAEGQTDENQYYTSKKLQLVTEINGSFKVGRPFVLDENDTNKRIYDDIYFYEDDFFKMDVSGNSLIFYSLSNDDDLEYVSIDEGYGRIVIKQGKSGIYKLVFDITTFEFDIEYKSPIDTPKYETIESCDIYSLDTSWQQMTVNPENSDEFVINNFAVSAKKLVSFFSHNIHTSNYKITLDDACKDKYAYQIGNKATADCRVKIGGTYNVYINRKTYVVRFELVNPETADYTLTSFNSKVSNLQQSTEHKYIFTCDYAASQYSDAPDFYDGASQKYNLTIQTSPLLHNGTGWFLTAGSYKLTINLQDFTIEVAEVLNHFTVKSDTTFLVISNSETAPADCSELGTEVSEITDMPITTISAVRYNENATPENGKTKWEVATGTSYDNGAISGNYTPVTEENVGNYVIKYTFYVGLTATTALPATNLKVAALSASVNSGTNDVLLPAVSALVVCGSTEVDFENINSNTLVNTNNAILSSTVALNTVYQIDVYLYINGDNAVVTSNQNRFEFNINMTLSVGMGY